MATKTEIISDELTVDPLVRNYSAMVDAEAKRDDGNEEYRIVEQGVFLSEAYQFLSHEINDPGPGSAFPVLVQIQEMAEFKTIQGTAVSDFQQVAAKNLMGFIAKAVDGGEKVIFMDFSKVNIAFSWDQMVLAGALSQAQLDTMKLLSNVPQSRWDELEVSPVSTQDITDAGG